MIQKVLEIIITFLTRFDSPHQTLNGVPLLLALIFCNHVPLRKCVYDGMIMRFTKVIYHSRIYIFTVFACQITNLLLENKSENYVELLFNCATNGNNKSLPLKFRKPCNLEFHL